MTISTKFIKILCGIESAEDYEDEMQYALVLQVSQKKLRQWLEKCRFRNYDCSNYRKIDGLY